MKRIITFLAVSVFLCCLFRVFAFEDSDPDARKPAEAKTKFQVTTDLLELRVVVTDKAGRIVENLRKDDFELLENGNRQTIAYFAVSKVEGVLDHMGSEENKAKDTAVKLQQVRSRMSEPPARTILLFTDALHLSFTSLNWVKRALYQFIDKQLTDQDLVAFASSETLGVAQQFTRDRNVLRHAIEQIQYGLFQRYSNLTPNLAVGVLLGREDAVQAAIDVVRREENMICPCSTLRMMTDQKASQVLIDASYTRQNTLAIIEQYAEQMKNLPGKRMIVVFSDGFTSYDRMGAEDRDEVKRTASQAVRSGVAIYTIDAKGLQTSQSIDATLKTTPVDPAYGALLDCISNCQTGDQECIDQCLQEIPSAYLCREDIENPDPVCGFPAPSLLERFFSESESEQLNAMDYLATETGGKMYERINDLDKALQSALDDNRFFYVLSYYLTENNSDDIFRNIKVNIRNHPEYSVRAPRGFLPSKKLESHADDAARTPQQRLIHAMIQPLPVTDLGISSFANFVVNEKDDKQVSLTVFFEGDRFQYRLLDPQRRSVELEIVSLVYDSSGKQVEGTSAQVVGKLSQGDIAQAKAMGYRFFRRLALKPGVYQVRTGVREEGTDRMGTASTWVEVPELDPDKLELSSLVLSNPLDSGLGDSDRIGVNELEQIKMVQGIPMYAQDDIFYYLFRVHRSSTISPDSHLLVMKELLKDGSPVKTEKWTVVPEEGMKVDSKGWFDLDGELDVHKLQSGLYEYRISVKEDGSKKSVQRTVFFGIL
jgi:VWFA-related protein